MTTATATDTALATRHRLLAFIQALPDEDVLRLGKALLPDAPAPEREFREPLIFTKEECEARLLEGLRQIRDGETMTWEEFMDRRRVKRTKRV